MNRSGGASPAGWAPQAGNLGTALGMITLGEVPLVIVETSDPVAVPDLDQCHPAVTRYGCGQQPADGPADLLAASADTFADRGLRGTANPSVRPDIGQPPDFPQDQLAW